MGINSCLYEINVMHHRVEPVDYRFTHKVFMFYLDLDELDSLNKDIWLFGCNKKSIFEFNDQDHVNFGQNSLKENIIKYAEQNGVTEPITQIKLLTNVRTFGYIFNPVSFYFCFNEKQEPVCAVCEVGNTFGELKPFFLGPETLNKNKFKSTQKKYYYISPFIDLDVPMDFQLTIPDKNLLIRIDDLKKEKKFLYATMTGKRKSLTAKQLFLYGLKFPFITLKVIFLIHYHAAVLHFIKKVPHHKKSANPDLQREVQRAYKKN